METITHILLNPGNPFYQIIVALFLGVFIGLRREVQQQSDGTATPGDILGVRTASLFVVLGTVTTFFADVTYLFAIMLGGLILLLLIAYMNGVFRLQRYGLTSEVTVLLLFLIGVLIGREQIILAILLAVVLGISSAYKEHIHMFARTFSLREWSGALQLLVISALILPILPKEPIDPVGIFVPFYMWLLVILISAIGFIGYFFSKYFGERKSVFATSFLGALVSSTATTIALAQKSKRAGANNVLLTTGVLIAIAVMQVRVVVEVLLLSPELRADFLAPAVAMALAAIALAGVYAILLRRGHKEQDIAVPDMHSPFEIVPALKFAAFFTVVLYAIYFGQRIFGDVGAYVTAVIVAFADVDAVVFSTILSFAAGGTVVKVAANVLAIAVIVNTLVKVLYIFLFGDKRFFRFMLLPLILVLAAGVIAMAMF